MALTILPVWLSGGFLALKGYQAKRALVESQMLQTARMLTHAVDRELASMLGALEVLAHSERLANGEMAIFHRHARDLVKAHPGADILLADATGQQLINTHEDFGTRLPKRNSPEAVQDVFSTARPVISDVHQGRITGRWMISIDVPVFIDGRVAYDLAIALPAEHIAALLTQDALPQHSIGAVFDNSRRLVARSHRHADLVGRSAPPVSREVAQAREGVFETINLEGEPMVVAFSRSTGSHWFAIVGTPTALVAAEMREWLLWMAFSCVAISMAALGLATLVARRLKGSIATVTMSAAGLAQGDVVHARCLCFAELTSVQRALARASRLLRRRQVRMQTAKVEAEQAHASKSRFMAAASHDLRQPLQALGLFLSVLEARSGHADGPLRSKLGFCHASLNEMLTDMLDLNKLDAGVTTPQPATFAVNTLLEQVAAPQAVLAHEKCLSLRWVRTGAWAYGDFALMQRILLNLVSNAVRHTETGGIVIGCRRRQGRRWIEVWDTGVGIPKEKFAAIFEEFHQLGNPERSREKGSGLGLAIVRRTADLLGLQVRVNSVQGKGSVFAIELPPDNEPDWGAEGI